MKVLFVFYIPSGGMETLNRQRALALKQKGVECHFLYLQQGTGLQNLDSSASVFVMNDDREIKKKLAMENYQAIVVSSDYTFLKKARNLGYRGALIYEVQGIGVDKQHTKKVLLEDAAPYIRKYSDGILYPQTPHLMEIFDQHFSGLKRFCFHDCLDTNTFTYRPLAPGAGPVIGWIGRLEKNKNWKDFLQIGARLVRFYPTLQLWLFEDSTLATERERNDFERHLDALKLRERTKIHANVPHKKMRDYYSKIGNSGGFLCSTSKIEGFGYAVLEALSCRCPVLTTDSDGVKSFVTHNVTGKYYQYGNIHQAVQEGKALIANRALTEKIRTNGVKHVKEQFSLEQYGNHFINMLKTLQNS